MNRLIASLVLPCALAAGAPVSAHAYFGGYYGFAGYGYYPHYRYYEPSGAVRLQVKPDRARVIVDGYYAGIVDDFDGLFERLHLALGPHEITLRLDGYKTHRLLLYAAAGHTLTIHYNMSQGNGEDEPDDQGVGRREGDLEERPTAGTQGGERRGEGGEIRMRVRPEDASVYVDGEFRGSGLQVQSFHLSPGRHIVEVVRPGFRTFERRVEVEVGRVARLDVEMVRR
jgi:hypothetical protein